MYKSLTEPSISKVTEESFDELMASLFVLITHHSMNQCEASVVSIVDSLNKLCEHSEIEYYPEQFKVFSKMKQLWNIKLFETQQFKSNAQLH